MTRTHKMPRLAAAIATLLLCFVAHAQAPVRFAGGRVDVIPGARLLVAVVPQTDTPPDTIRVRLDDGRELDAELVGFDARPAPIDPRMPRLWLPEPLAWTASPPSAVPRRPTLWRLLIDPPADARGQGLWLGGRRIPLVWRPDPWTLAPATDRGAPWASPNPPAWRDDPVLAELAEPDRQAPTRRWRWLLATGRLAPDNPADASPPFVPIESPEQLQRALARAPLSERALEALAASIEARWRLALARLWRADADLAASVRQRLAGGVDLSPGPVVPAYAPLGIATDRLLDDLLDPAHDDARLAQLARAWLADQPRALLWVIDDAGRPGATPGEVRPTLGVANLGGDPEAVLSAIDTGALETGIQPAPARTAVALRPIVPAPRDAAPSFATARVRVGTQTESVPLAPFPFAAPPPGLVVGPLKRDWTLDEWRGGPASASPPNDAFTTALVHRDAALDAPGAHGWRVYVECLAPEFSPEDSVTIWLGAFQQPHSVVRVNAEGRRTDPRAPRAAAAWTDVSHAPDRWSFQIEVPPAAIDASGVLRISIERRDANGLRTAAPRRMLPWQNEPGRVAIDTASWAGL